MNEEKSHPQDCICTKCILMASQSFFDVLEVLKDRYGHDTEFLKGLKETGMAIYVYPPEDPVTRIVAMSLTDEAKKDVEAANLKNMDESDKEDAKDEN